MNRPEIFETALHRFRTHAFQTALALTGLVVGTAAIILTISLGLTGRRYVLAQIEGVGSRLIWADYQGTVTSGVLREIDDRMLEGDLVAVEERHDLFSGVMAIVALHGQTTALSGTVNLDILGATANYPHLRKNLRLLQGRFVDEDDVRAQAKVCVVNRRLYEELFANDDSPEKMVRTLGTSFVVVGEFEEPVDTLGQGDVTSETIFVPITTAWLFTPAHWVKTLFAEVRDPRDIPSASEAVRQILEERHRRGSRYQVENMSTVLRVADAVSWGLLVVFALVAAVSVVVGGVGIMNVLLVSVEQRTREIGLRKSVGARRRDILGQFLLEALLLGGMGAAGGAAIGLGIPLLAALLLPAVGVTVSVTSALLAVLFCCGVTVLFGVVPARRAAALDPVEALRHE
jgi:putative ABC transport system permease protein